MLQKKKGKGRDRVVDVCIPVSAMNESQGYLVSYPLYQNDPNSFSLL
jgi:hypothetical protein